MKDKKQIDLFLEIKGPKPDKRTTYMLFCIFANIQIWMSRVSSDIRGKETATTRPTSKEMACVRGRVGGWRLRDWRQTAQDRTTWNSCVAASQ